MKRFFALFVLTFFLCPLFIFSQESSRDEGGFEFGINFGVYVPSKHSANYYNGTIGNLNNTQWVMSNRVFYDSIFNRLDAIDTIFIDTDGWPTNMRYKIAMMPGIYGQYSFNSTYALYFNFNYMKLTTQDALIFTIPKPFTSFPDHTLCPIRGVEERVYFDIGLKRNFPVSDRFGYFVIGGLNVNNTTVIKSSFFVEEKEYSIINNYLNGVYIGPNSQTFNMKQGGIGWGLYFSAGASFMFGDVGFEPGFNAHFISTQLDGYNKYRPGAGFYLRFMLNNLLFNGE
ncbi:MAG: hypothetical protein IPH84_06595 [Bacteroidales bacterium]|nr:hypothetical protein [Bacteroidales bacterium]